MRKIWLAAVIPVMLAGIQCRQNVKTAFLVSSDQVGKLSRNSRVQDLEAVFEGDSLVKDSVITKLGSSPGRIKVFEKGGKHLLTLNPSADSLKRIESIRILDSRFTTEEGISLGSTFGDIRKHYPVRKIITSLNNVVILIKGQDYYFTISREQLPASLRFSTDVDIEEVQIPDKAKIKYLMVGWD
jgi:hypothetical protein